MTTTVEYNTCRDDASVDQMDVSIDKNAIKQSVADGMHEMSVLFDDPTWTYNAKMNMAGYVNYWYSNMNWITGQLDKTLDQMKNLAGQDTGTEIHIEQVDKLVYRKKVQQASLERAEIYYNESKAFYEKVTGETYQPYSLRKKAKDTTKQYAMAKLKFELKDVKTK